MSSPAEPLQAQCSTHPEEAAMHVCSRCGRFCCLTCKASDGLCRNCVGFAAMERPSALAVASVVMGSLGLCLVLPGVIAVVLAQIELMRIQRQKAPLAGRTFALSGRALGVVSMILGVLLYLATLR